jgi:Rrf2 family protein
MRYNKVISSTKISRETGINAATVNKLLALLVKGNVLIAIRGSKGGYKPSRKLEDISIKEIIEAIEGPVTLTNCLDNNTSDKCNLIDSCITKNTWSEVNNAVANTLHSIKVDHINKQFFSANNFNK